MRCLVSILIAIAYVCPAWGNSCYEKAAAFISVPHDRSSAITLEARRVKSFDEGSFIYDLGKEEISIRAESFAAENFLKNVARGRCAARQTVRLEPVRKSPFNTEFKAVRPRHLR